MVKTITNQASANLIINELNFITITASSIGATNGEITNVYSSVLNASTLNVDDINISSLDIENATIDTINSSQVNSSNASIDYISGTNADYTNINSSLENLQNQIDNIDLQDFDLINVSTLNASTISASTANIDYVYGDTANYTNINASLDDLQTQIDNIDLQDFDLINASQINASNASIDYISGTNASYTNINASLTDLQTQIDNIDITDFGVINVSTLNASTLNGQDVDALISQVNQNTTDIDNNEVAIANNTTTISNVSSQVAINTATLSLLSTDVTNVSTKASTNATNIYNISNTGLTTAGYVYATNVCASNQITGNNIKANNLLEGDDVKAYSEYQIVTAGTSTVTKIIDSNAVTDETNGYINNMYSIRNNVSSIHCSTGNFGVLNVSTIYASESIIDTTTHTQHDASDLNVSDFHCSYGRSDSYFNAVTLNASTVNGSTGNFDNIDTSITNINSSLSSLQSQISSNDTDIATNTANITTNTNDIATNTTNITTNTNDITTINNTLTNFNTSFTTTLINTATTNSSVINSSTITSVNLNSSFNNTSITNSTTVNVSTINGSTITTSGDITAGNIVYANNRLRTNIIQNNGTGTIDFAGSGFITVPYIKISANGYVDTTTLNGSTVNASTGNLTTLNVSNIYASLAVVDETIHTQHDANDLNVSDFHCSYGRSDSYFNADTLNASTGNISETYTSLLVADATTITRCGIEEIVMAGSLPPVSIVRASNGSTVINASTINVKTKLNVSGSTEMTGNVTVNGFNTVNGGITINDDGSPNYRGLTINGQGQDANYVFQYNGADKWDVFRSSNFGGSYCINNKVVPERVLSIDETNSYWRIGDNTAPSTYQVTIGGNGKLKTTTSVDTTTVNATTINATTSNSSTVNASSVQVIRNSGIADILCKNTAGSANLLVESTGSLEETQVQINADNWNNIKVASNTDNWLQLNEKTTNNGVNNWLYMNSGATENTGITQANKIEMSGFGNGDILLHNSSNNKINISNATYQAQISGYANRFSIGTTGTYMEFATSSLTNSAMTLNDTRLHLYNDRKITENTVPINHTTVYSTRVNSGTLTAGYFKFGNDSQATNVTFGTGFPFKLYGGSSVEGTALSRKGFRVPSPGVFAITHSYTNDVFNFKLSNNAYAGYYEVEVRMTIQNTTGSRADYQIMIDSSTASGDDVGANSDIGHSAYGYARMSEGHTVTMCPKAIVELADTSDYIRIRSYVEFGTGINFSDSTTNYRVWNFRISFKYLGSAD